MRKTRYWRRCQGYNARQDVASTECAKTDAGEVNVIWEGDARQASAVIECVRPDAGDAVGNRDARQAAVIEC